MSPRIILLIALLVGFAAGVAAVALGFTDILVQIATAITFAILVGGPLWWYYRPKSGQEQ